MFGLNENEMELYKDLTQDYAVKDIAPMVMKKSQFITPMLNSGDKPRPDTVHVRQILNDLEAIIMLTASHISYEYAHLQCESEKTEEEIIEHLHTKYDSFLISQFIKYGITFTTDVTSRILGELVLELPYLYSSCIEDEEFDGDSFLEEKMEAYNNYLLDNFPEGRIDEGGDEQE